MRPNADNQTATLSNKQKADRAGDRESQRTSDTSRGQIVENNVVGSCLHRQRQRLALADAERSLLDDCRNHVFQALDVKPFRQCRDRRRDLRGHGWRDENGTENRRNKVELTDISEGD